ncbi:MULTISPECIES: DUF3089 domain-containing protein [unclassified Gordonia (in: high G+C Gram-positive bacteria)]|uniref:DUF3089 domain-containing protein n=1 Tax=unclassified Gordonia (in: high G+C Gram-positive bacteria) TaxID=2657482 RepID=UPI001F1024E8|nr:DUF3089 domain-containing protein [Gordonia sp. ABSL49_1]MCH5643866.1 DUF3089 domain-containing protein [Gordonia sp. ABSL49_1]
MLHPESRRAHALSSRGTFRLRIVVGLAIASLALTFGVHAPADAAPPPTLWLCSSAMTADPCDLPQDTTDLLTGRVTNPLPVTAAQRSVDCFYVYGTATNTLSLNAPLVAAPEIKSGAELQSARFNSMCRIFAPVYRQISLPGLVAVNLGATTEPVAIAYRDVLAAWNNYLTHANMGRGVVFIGHSQGTFLLRKLIREQVDPNPVVRARLAGAILLGGNVKTAPGRTVGGDFNNIPICTRHGQYGCVTAYSTNIVYPPLSLLGNSSLDIVSLRFGLPMGPNYQVACTDPAVLSGSRRPVGITVPSKPYAPGAIAIALGYTTFPEAWPTSSSTWTIGRGRGVGRCEEVNGYRQYHIRMVVPQQINEAPLFDLHALDINFGLDRLVAIASQQAASWHAHSH